MSFNTCYFMRNEDRKPQWRVIDAKGQTLGRLATDIADALRGRDKATFTPHVDGGDYIVVVNCASLNFTGNKLETKEYVRYSGWRSGKKVRSLEEQMQKDPTEVLRLAVKGMLPRNRLSRQVIKKLKLYAGSEHCHSAQVAA